jgi:Inner membrane protein YgaP-like, transmembrane domain
MKLNVGGIDRVLRIAAGVALLALVFVLDGGARWLGLVGLVPLATGLAGYCPAYALFGLSTCSTQAKHA